MSNEEQVPEPTRSMGSRTIITSPSVTAQLLSLMIQLQPQVEKPAVRAVEPKKVKKADPKRKRVRKRARKARKTGRR